MLAVLVAPTKCDAELRSRLDRVGADCAALGTSYGVAVTDGRSRVYLSQNAFIRDELEPERLEAIAALITSAVFYSVDFSDIALCRRVLAAIADDPALLVDNDHGVFLSGPEFVRALRQRPDWDWRTDHPR